MRRIMGLSALSACATISCLVQTGTISPRAAANSRLDQMPKELEVQFALSDLPPHLRSDATAYVLNSEKGYELARTGANGSSCIVERTEWERADFRNDVYTAMCFDSEGSKSILPVWMDTASLRAEGKLTAEEVKLRIKKEIPAESVRRRTSCQPRPADRSALRRTC